MTPFQLMNRRMSHAIDKRFNDQASAARHRACCGGRVHAKLGLMRTGMRSALLQLRKRCPESLAVRLLDPVLSDLVTGRAPRAHNSAFTGIAAHLVVDF